MGVLNLEKIERDIANVEREVSTIHKDVEKMEYGMIKKTLSSNKAIVLQTIALVLVLIGLAVANEHRLTSLEIKQEAETMVRTENDNRMMDAIKALQAVTTNISENQIRVVTILDGIEKRHAVEDGRRPR